ncbi:MAG: aminotransferase class V-fold PLP-dependent enzyme [Acholeplasmatales bacterium]|nr:MAG: aminotransferase class V-fold PLP-dependent enzyme [Acholeplasmatales bacterium]
MTLNQRATPLYDALWAYANDTTLPFDVPGHKKGVAIPKRFREDIGEQVFKMDANSTKALDLLSNPEGVIAEAEKLAAALFQADHAFFLVNGSTAGVQNMILATVGEGEKIILPRNVHKSAINALILAGAVPVYVEPAIEPYSGLAMGVPTNTFIEAIAHHPDAAAVFLLHPTYHGFTCDVKAIATAAHAHGMAVLADQAHGSLFSLHEKLPQSAIALGADLATLSLHKSGGSLTQSSLLLLREGLVEKGRVRTAINLMQTSSASYLLMASLDVARADLAATAHARIEALLTHLDAFRQRLAKMPALRVLDQTLCQGGHAFTHDPMKLCIDISAYDTSGFEVYDRFKSDANIQLELAESRVVLALASLADDAVSLSALARTFESMFETMPLRAKTREPFVLMTFPPRVLTPREAYYKPSESMAAVDAVGRIAADALMIYPPGIPIVVPGEVITEKVVEQFVRWFESDNFLVGGTAKGADVFIRVIKEEGDTPWH